MNLEKNNAKKIEKFIKDHSGEFKKREVWNNLPNKISCVLYNKILNELYKSNRVSIDAEGKVGWIYYPKLAKKYISKPELFWKGNG